MQVAANVKHLKIGDITVVIDNVGVLKKNIKYPTGKKDGNKLGKRKRKLTNHAAINYGDTVIVSEEIYEELEKRVKHNKKIKE